MSMVHLSFGMKEPASPHLRSEVAIIAGMAPATLPTERHAVGGIRGDYDLIRDTMAEVIDGFEDFNRRVRQPLGFRINQPARELVFLTPQVAPNSPPPPCRTTSHPATAAPADMRPHDQWNTTIYSDNDRYRGIKNLRTLVFMNPDDMRARDISTAAGRHHRAPPRTAASDPSSYRAIPYDMPRGSRRATCRR